MESSSASSKFWFRDHQEIENSTQSETSSDVSSESSERDSELELKTMTGKGIKHLCSELLELKAASSEEFKRNIFSNYSAFVRIFDQVQGVENELVQLKSHIATQKALVKDLVDGVYMKILSKETIHAIIEDDACAVPPPPSELEVHINDVSETLDTLLSENRIDEALTILECEDENFQGIQFENNFPSHELMLYISAISERKDMLILQLTLIADNPKVAAPELQKALAGLCRLGDSHLAVQLLLKYYRSHIVRGTYNLEHSKSSLHGIYIRELAKFVFSMISQAARSFVMLCGESSTYDSELMQWAREETQVFVTCFNKYLKSVSERSGALSTVVEAVQFALSFCSLLETQKLVLRPYLVKHLRPFLEEFLHIHINHFKKVVAIFSVSDNWELGRYLASGIFGEGCFSVVVGQPLQYCLLTNSGRKFLTLLQAITEDVSPLVSLQMGGSVLGELRNLFMEYVVILESALTWDTSMAEKDGGSRINLAESMLQQVSVLANLSTLVGFLTVMVKNIFRSINHTDSEIMGNHSGGHQQTEHENFIQFIEEASNQLRDIFYQKFILRVLSTESSHVPTGDIHNDGHCDSSVCLTPSGILQVFFLELRKLEQLAEENVFELDWLMELFRELMEAIFVWASKNKLIQATSEENMTMGDTDDSKQFVLDVQFLVEIAMYGGYFSINPLLLVSLMKSTFRSAGLYPIRDVNNDGWAIAAATKTIQKLLELEKTTLPPNKETRGILEEELHTKQSDYAGYYSQEDALSSSENYVDWEEAVATDESGVSIHAEMAPLNTEFSHQEGSAERDSNDRISPKLTGSPVEIESTKSENAVNDELMMVDKSSLSSATFSVGTFGESSERTASMSGVLDTVINKPEAAASIVLPNTVVALLKDSIGLNSQDDEDKLEFDFNKDKLKKAAPVNLFISKEFDEK